MPLVYKQCFIQYQAKTDGTPAHGYVEFTPNTTLMGEGGITFNMRPIVVQLDANGRVDVSLLSNDNVDITPDNWSWTIQEKIEGGGIWWFQLTGVMPEPVDLRSLYPLNDAPPTIVDPGTPGQAATIAVGTTATGAPGTPANVNNSGNQTHAVLDFTIPEGIQGIQGIRGIQGIQGGQGIQGNKGDKGDKGDIGNAAYVDAGATFTGPPGTDASVDNSGTISNAVFDFTIPRGDTGADNAPHIGSTEPVDPAIVEWFDTSEASVRGVANSGDTMTGPLILSGDATDPLGATTLQQAAMKSTIGNLLTADQASMETGLTGLTGNNGTLTRDTGDAYHGSACASITWTNNGSLTIGSTGTDGIPVVAGQAYTVSARMKQSTGTLAFTYIISWYDAAGVAVGTSTVVIATVGTNWTLITGTLIAPAGAAYARPYLYQSGGTGTTTKFDALGLWAGVGGEWSMPGTSILGMGKRTNENGDIEFWDDESAAWVGPYAMKSTIGNMLPDNVASGTEALGTTEGFNIVNATGASSADWSAQGSKSLKVTATITSVSVYAVIGGTYNVGGIPVAAGQTYTVSLTLYSPTVSGNGGLNIRWFGPDTSTFIGSSSTSASVSSTATRHELTVVAPAGAAYASAYWIPAAAVSAGESYYIDEVDFWAGAGGNWAMPGIPITGQGTRTTRPNTDDVLVESWDESLNRWQTVHYDSGWRNIQAGASYLGLNDKTCRIRRIGSQIHFQVSVDATAMPAVNADVVLIPVGFATDFAYFGDGGWYAAESQNISGQYNYSGYFRVNKGSATAVNMRGVFSWTTNQPIPISLPGTLHTPASQ